MLRRLFLTSTAVVGVVIGISVATQGQTPAADGSKRGVQQAPAAAALDAAIASIPKDWKVGKTAWVAP